jgi:PBSX family phage terminase large subunit
MELSQHSTSLLEPPKQKIRKLNRKQDEFIFSTAEFVCIKGTWGCGKSLAMIISACQECEKYPNNLYLLVRKEYIDLKNSTMKDWDDEFGDRYPIVGNEARFPNGSTLIFAHGDDLNSFKNINLGGAGMIQAEEMSEEDFWFLKGRLRRKEGTRQLRLECNFDGKNYIYKLFNEQKLGHLITTNTFDNERNLPSDYILGLKKLPKKMQERHLYGSDDDMEGLVWDEFSQSTSVVDPFYIPEDWDKRIAIDYGYTNPTAVLWGATDWDGNTYIFDEHYEANKPISYHADKIKERKYQNIKQRVIDPSTFSKTQHKDSGVFSIADEYLANGICLEPANNDVLLGLTKVNEGFKSRKLFIFKSCTNLIREIQGYKWKKLKLHSDKNAPEEPVKKDDHANDALRYLYMTRPEESELEDISKRINPNSAWGRVMSSRKEQDTAIYSR